VRNSAIVAPQDAVSVAVPHPEERQSSIEKNHSAAIQLPPFFVCGVIANRRLQGFLNVDRGDDPHRPRSFSRDLPSKSEPA
jgi:hypothetical protein